MRGAQFLIGYGLSKFMSLGLYGVWRSFPIGSVIVLAMCLYIYQKGDWKYTKLIEEDRQQEEVFEAAVMEGGK